MEVSKENKFLTFWPIQYLRPPRSLQAHPTHLYQEVEISF